jgi:asparagine synthase (glutamine-hydrolysing)
MCGILGWVGPRRPADANRFQEALDLLAHRGPDDRGVLERPEVLLGHRRLSILDLSPSGHQPMVDSASDSAIVFNGEIYNYLELRGELQKGGRGFRSASDTEVLHRAVLEWGDGALARLNGMWAFALWEPRRRRLFFARDRFGVKPFYYCSGEYGFAFASEPKALLALFPEHRKVCEESLFQFLEEGLLYADGRSFYRGVHVLRPGHCGEFDPASGRLRIWRYWDYPAGEAAEGAPGVAAEEFAGLLDDAVRLRLRSDVPVGVALSGGLDSTAVLAASMSPGAGRRVCFTSVYGGADRGEAPWAAMASAPYGIRPVEVEAPKGQWLETLRRIAWHMDGPGYSPAVYPLWYLMREARQRGVPVLLEGQGADEALAGYPQYATIDFIRHLRSVWRHPSQVPALARRWRSLTRTFSARWATLWLLRELFPPLVAVNRRRVAAGATLRPEFAARARAAAPAQKMAPPAGMDEVGARLWIDHSRNILPGLLHYGDAISMAHGVESRLPFMDYRLVEWAFSRGAASKIRDGQTKWVLREYLRGRKQERIAARVDKQGYPTPVERWLREDGGALARDLLLAPAARIREFCDPEAVRRLVTLHLQGKPAAGNHLYRLLSTEMWLQGCGLG